MIAACLGISMVFSGCGGDGGKPPEDPPGTPQCQDDPDNPSEFVNGYPEHPGGGNPGNAEFGLAQRVAPTELQLSADTAPLDAVLVVNAFPALQFDRPVDLAAVPDTGELVVVEHRGVIRAFDNAASTSNSHVALSLTDRVDYDGNEQGLVKITFDPDYASNGYVYVTYAGRETVDPARCAQACSVVARFTRANADPLRFDPDSEQHVLVLEQPDGGHNVGNLVFGPDGYLYIGVGDGGFSLTPRINAQDRTDLYGSVLRVDVSSGLPYGIPPDNPFVGAGNEAEGVPGAGNPVREEIWAYGLRNPHRFSFDPVTRELWLADVGQAAREEVNLIVAGGNYGWPAYEGTIDNGRTDIGRDASIYIAPVLEYDHDEGTSITGGHVYRGSRLPNLYGHYLFGDFVAGTLWATLRTGAGVSPKSVVTNQTGGFGIASMELIDEEIYIVNLGQGVIQTLSPTDDNAASVPQWLSQTGVFEDLTTLQTTPGLIPYDVNTPLWSDGSVKYRWLALPDTGAIRFATTGAWTFPTGAVLVKHFGMDLDTTKTCDGLHHLETRILINTNNGWIGYTYRWNAEQTDAELISGGASETLTRRTDLGTFTQLYEYPSSADCAVCHNPTDGPVLGARTAQLNRSFDYPLAQDNQLRALDHVGAFDSAIETPDTYTSFPELSDDASTVQSRARAYLSANCAQCHNPSNTIPTTIDLRYSDNDDDIGAIDMEPATSDFGLEDALIIAPGDPSRSTLWLRMQTRGQDQMPPLATHLVDDEAVELIGSWIDAMPPTTP